MIEAMHLAYADRGEYMGDADFVEIPIEGLLNPDYVATRSALIQMSTTNGSPLPGDPWAYEDETYFLSDARIRPRGPPHNPLRSGG